MIALAEGVEQRIEELKAQMEEVDKQEEKLLRNNGLWCKSKLRE